MQEVLRERLRLEADIERALANGEFFLEYQPIVELRTRSLLGVEALARWRHPERGVLMPKHFIQLAEESGHIIELGRLVLQRACQDWQRWCDEVVGGPGSSHLECVGPPSAAGRPGARTSTRRCDRRASNPAIWSSS